jgi:polyribonucleotide nucleotidyltransferase
MVIKGTPGQIANATLQIADLLVASAAQRDNKDPEASADVTVDPSATTSIKYLVHRSAVGAIIGKAGSVIQETQKTTGARVHVSNDPLPQSTEKSVTISGTPNQIEEAAIRVLMQLSENPLRSGTKVYPYVPGQPIFAATPYGLPTPYGQASVTALYGQQSLPYGIPPTQTTPAASSTQKIAIPTVCAGCVIGKGGSVIRDLRAQSGTNISIADPEPASPNERVVTLTGTPQGIQTAVFLIRNLVEQYQPPANY